MRRILATLAVVVALLFSARSACADFYDGLAAYNRGDYATALQVPRLTISRILNHKEDGVTSIYDRHSYFKEKLAALELWGRRLDQILTPDGSENVVPLKQRG